MCERPTSLRATPLPALTSLRFFAAFHVLLYHFLPYYRDHGPFAWLIGSGYTGVSFFFVLSGFILVYSHAPEYLVSRASTRRFYVARFARVYPIYLLALLVTFALEWRLLLVPSHLLAVAADLLMLQSWSIKTAILFLAPAWTLSCEAFFYLVFPLFILRLRPSSLAKALAALTSLWLVTQLAPIWYLHHTFGNHLSLWPPEHPSSLLNLIQFTPIFALPEFLAGMILGWLVLTFPPTRRAAIIFLFAGPITLALALRASGHLPYIMLHNGLLLPAYAAIILGLTQTAAPSRWLSAKLLILLGESSFALYLFHWFLAWYWPSATIPAVIAKIILAFALSVMIHLAIERPARQIILKRSHNLSGS